MYRAALVVCLFGACHKPIDDTPMPDAPVIVDPSISGTISTSATWSGTIRVVGPTTITQAATITVEAGTTIIASPTASITVDGRFVAVGTSAAKIVMKPATTGGGWQGFYVSGHLTFAYVEQTGGGIEVQSGIATITDTVLAHLHDARDFLVMDGGTLDLEYSTIGPVAGTTDVIHCDFHFNAGDPNTIKIVHSDVSGASNAADYYGGNSADFTFDNWFSNTDDIVTEIGSPVTGDFSNGWFEKGAASTAATGSSFTTNSLSQTRLTDTGPRP